MLQRDLKVLLEDLIQTLPDPQHIPYLPDEVAVEYNHLRWKILAVIRVMNRYERERIDYVV